MTERGPTRGRDLFRTIVRTLFGVIFLVGGVVHLVQGRLAPASYTVFGDTAAFGWLSRLWESFVMPNIG